MNIKASISISRWSNDTINITVHDETSGIQFVDLILGNYILNSPMKTIP